MKNSRSEAYAAAGVDITAGYKAVELMKESVQSTYTDGVLGDIGSFGGLFEPDLAGMTKPILVSGTDGVGTKLRLAFLMDKHDTVGIDCVAMCVNDIICCGAKPLFFLDYIAIGKNIPEKVAALVTEDKPAWTGSATELLALLGEDMKPNILTRRLNVKSGELRSEYRIALAVSHHRNGSCISLSRLEQEA